MPTPRTAATRWQHIDTASEVDAEGRLTISVHLAELESGEEFTCSVTGRGTADGGYFIAALQAMAAILGAATGSPVDGTRQCTKADFN